MKRSFDIIVIGGGHAGSEAAHAAAKLGMKTLLLTNNVDQIASMPCNPAVGGPAKSHLVKEIDALGGIMALAADATYMQLKTLNSSKGPAVRALRAQSDKKEYSNWVRQYLEATPNLTIYQSGAKALIYDSQYIVSSDLGQNTSKTIYQQNKAKVMGVTTNLDEEIYANAIVLTAGTFLEGRIFSGNKFESAGRSGEQASLGLSGNIQDWGLKTGRLKTGTPARLNRDTIDYSQLEEAPGDALPESDRNSSQSFFSFLPQRPRRRQYLCHITRTNSETHKIIMDNLHQSPMYSGEVDATGPRYCPSIEDKVVRFPHNPSHHFFLEPEGRSTNEIYLQGCSTSLPVDVQWQIVRSLPGCENAEIVRPAYAVEYDYFPGIQFKHSFESKNISGLFVSGQVLGTSGYEEAAAQGLMAGINAAIYAYRNIDKRDFSNKNFASYASQHESFELTRSESYIGTLVDDLVTKEINEPYRMLTSRSEYRLLLRQDNADQRLTAKGRELGLVDDFRWSCFEEKQARIAEEIKLLGFVKVPVENSRVSLAEKLKNPELNYENFLRDEQVAQYIAEMKDIELRKLDAAEIHDRSLRFAFEVETAIKYEGYIARQMQQIREMEKYDKILIPEDFDFGACLQIRLETREKLSKIKPKNLAQASRIAGVTPSDVSLISILLESRRRKLVV